MKKLLLIFAFLIPFLGISQNPNKWLIDKVSEDSGEYKSHFIANDGDLTGAERYMKAAYLQAIGDEMRDSIKFMYLGTSATSIRSDGIFDYVTNTYDMSGLDNDGEQTTEGSQPYVTGHIAPSQNEGMLNPNGGTRYMTHPEISFSATDEWTVTAVLNWNGSALNNSIVFGGTATVSALYLIRSSANVFHLRNASGGGTSGSVGGTESLVGKNSVVTLTAAGDGVCKVYKDGVFFENITVVTNFVFSNLVGIDISNTQYEGKYNAHIIRSISLDSTQVSNEAIFLQSVYHEIASKVIGDYNLSSTSLDVVASSDGTVITMATGNADWATGLARWRYYSDDSQIGSWGNKLYNKAARDVIIANPPENWHVATEAELTIIAVIDGNNLKVESTDYWTTANGTNHSGFSAVGSGMVNTDGTFTGINTTVGFWCADSDKALIITDAGAATITSVSANEGYNIRLIQD